MKKTEVENLVSHPLNALNVISIQILAIYSILRLTVHTWFHILGNGEEASLLRKIFNLYIRPSTGQVPAHRNFPCKYGK